MVLMNVLFGLAVADIQALYKKARVKHLMQQVKAISYMETMIHFSSVFLSLFPWIWRFLQKNFYCCPKTGRFVSLTTLKKSKMISVDIEESLRKKLSQQHKSMTEASEMEQKFNEFTQKLEKMVMEHMANLTKTSPQKQSKWTKVRESFLEQDET